MESTFPKDFLYKAWLFHSDFCTVWSEAGEKILWLFWVTELLSDGLKGTSLNSVWPQEGDGHLTQGNEGSLGTWFSLRSANRQCGQKYFKVLFLKVQLFDHYLAGCSYISAARSLGKDLSRACRVDAVSNNPWNLVSRDGGLEKREGKWLGRDAVVLITSTSFLEKEKSRKNATLYSTGNVQKPLEESSFARFLFKQEVDTLE